MYKRKPPYRSHFHLLYFFLRKLLTCQPRQIKLGGEEETASYPPCYYNFQEKKLYVAQGNEYNKLSSYGARGIRIHPNITTRQASHFREGSRFCLNNPGDQPVASPPSSSVLVLYNLGKISCLRKS